MVYPRGWLIGFVAILHITLAPTAGRAEPVTRDRIEALPAGEQPAWKDYFARSQAAAKADAAALEAELAANQMTAALRAPDGGDFRLPAESGDAWYARDAASGLADVVLSYQAPSGGWSKHTGYRRGPRKAGMQWSSQSEPGAAPHYLCTFDNRSTTEQLQFLANMWEATKRDDCQAAFVKGLNFVLAAQYPNGGWPQVYPLEGGYHDSITFNDDAQTHILELLDAINRNEPRFAFLDESQRKQVADAYAAGLACVLRAQVELDGVKTVWCAQHDALTLAPAAARVFEPASLSGLESARVLQFLMRIEHPSAEVIEAIEAGLAWFDRVKSTGFKRTRLNGKRAYVPDETSTEVYWARFYDLKTGKAIFPGRDGVMYATFNELAAENEVNYDFFTSLPGSIVTNGQKKWRKMLSTQAAEP